MKPRLRNTYRSPSRPGRCWQRRALGGSSAARRAYAMGSPDARSRFGLAPRPTAGRGSGASAPHAGTAARRGPGPGHECLFNTTRAGPPRAAAARRCAGAQSPCAAPTLRPIPGCGRDPKHPDAASGPVFTNSVGTARCAPRWGEVGSLQHRRIRLRPGRRRATGGTPGRGRGQGLEGGGAGGEQVSVWGVCAL